jgi:hypothetical protein
VPLPPRLRRLSRSIRRLLPRNVGWAIARARLRHALAHTALRNARYLHRGAGPDVWAGRPYAIRGVSPLLSTERITVTCFQRVIIQAQRISA